MLETNWNFQERWITGDLVFVRGWTGLWKVLPSCQKHDENWFFWSPKHWTKYCWFFLLTGEVAWLWILGSVIRAPKFKLHICVNIIMRVGDEIFWRYLLIILWLYKIAILEKCFSKKGVIVIGFTVSFGIYLLYYHRFWTIFDGNVHSVKQAKNVTYCDWALMTWR